MKKIITIGKPTHLQLLGKSGSNNAPTACGLYISVGSSCFDPRGVDCLSCIATKEYNFRMYGKGNDMKGLTYRFEEKSGFNGTGAWVVYGPESAFGHRRMVNLFATEQECIDYIEEPQ